MINLNLFINLQVLFEIATGLRAYSESRHIKFLVSKFSNLFFIISDNNNLLL